MGKKKEEKELLEVFAEYGADPEVLREWDLVVERARKVRGVLKIKTASGYRMLKRVRTNAARLRFIHETIEHLARSGFPDVPRFIRTKYGDPYVVLPDGLYYLTNWLPGKEADLKKTKNLFLAAETLARLHSAGADCEGAGFGQETREDFSGLWGKYRAKLGSYDQHLEDTRESNGMDDLYREHRGDLLRMIDHASEQLSKSPYGQVLEWAREHKTICHGSFSRQNLIVDRERMAVIDFDHCHFGHPIHDLGALLARYMPRNEWDAEIGFSVIDVYRGVRELSEEEMTVLAAYLSFPQRTLEVVESYFERTRDWEVKRFANRFRKMLRLDNAREAFVQDLIDRYGLAMAAPSFAPNIEGMDAYDDVEDLESSSVETRKDGWEEVEGLRDAVSEAEPVSVVVEEEMPTVSLAGYEEDDRGNRKPPRPKAKRPTPEVRRPQKPGLWTPKR